MYAMQFATVKVFLSKIINYNMEWQLFDEYRMVKIQNILNYLIVTQKCHIASWILVNIGGGNGFLPRGIKPLPPSMLTYHQ